MKRLAGSVRFDEYFKIQWYDEISLCWRDIQKAYASVDEARESMTSGKKWRVMVVTEKGRYPLQEA
jgi:hypothetical protein